MPVFTASRPGASYGHSVGILLLDYRGPFVPGDVGNASSYDYPVLFRTVPGATSRRVFDGDKALEDDVVEAARALEADGVKGITSDCGFFLAYQQVVAAAVRVPVYLSSLLQLRAIAAMLDPAKTIGVIAANGRSLTPGLIAQAGIDPVRVIPRGMETEPVFGGSVTGGCKMLDTEAVGAEVVHVARHLKYANPSMGAILIECSMLPAYSKAVQEATGLPVFDFITMIDTFHGVTHH